MGAEATFPVCTCVPRRCCTYPHEVKGTDRCLGVPEALHCHASASRQLTLSRVRQYQLKKGTSAMQWHPASASQIRSGTTGLWLIWPRARKSASISLSRTAEVDSPSTTGQGGGEAGQDNWSLTVGRDMS